MEAVFLEVQDIDIMLGEAQYILNAPMGLSQGGIQGHDPGIVVCYPVDAPGPHPKNTLDHAAP